MKDNERLDHMIENSQFGENSDDYWFSFANQKKLAWRIAADLFVNSDVEAEEAIQTSKQFVDEFYNLVIAPKSWDRSI